MPHPMLFLTGSFGLLICLFIIFIIVDEIEKSGAPSGVPQFLRVTAVVSAVTMLLSVLV